MSGITVSSDFNEFMYDPIEREEALQKRLEEYYRSPSQPVYQKEFMNRDCNFPIINVPIGLLMYRLENGRTVSLQDEFLAQHSDLPDDFFSRDVNSPETQFVQHELLSKLQDKLAYFKDPDKKQDEALIITNKGFVVNGNRRLCCWRILYFDDKETYKHFEYIKVAVLPESDEKAIEKLEADFQIAPDIKDDYSWHAEAKLMKKRIVERREDKEDVAKYYQLKPKEIDERIQMLFYAEEYLKRKNMERQWSQLEDYYAFEQLVKNRDKLTDTVDKSLLESITYAFITTSKGEGGVEGRLYRKIPEVRKNLDAIIEAIAEDLPEIVVSNPEIDDSDFLADNSDDTINRKVSIAQALVNVSEKTQKRIVDISEQVIIDENAKEREKKSTNYLIDQVRKANTSLENALNAIEEGVNTKGLQNILDLIESNVIKMRKWLEKRENNN